MSTTGFHYDPRYLLHDTGMSFPERSERLSGTLKYLQTLPLWPKLTQLPPLSSSNTIDPLPYIRAIHDEQYLRRFEEQCRYGERFLDQNIDIPICEKSYEIASLAVSGILNTCDAVMERKVDNAFCMIRPPGHHAERDKALGFCLLNNTAIAAYYLRKRWNLSRVAIVDWDVHHANGIQHIFEEDPTVLTISLHQNPATLWPHSGYSWEKGKGPGEGFTLNITFEPGATDADYQTAFNKYVLPKLRSFAPQALLISAGFDAHLYDTQGQLHLSSIGYAWMTRQLKNIAQTCAGGRLISILEGGYNLISLKWSIAAHLEALLEPTWEEQLMSYKSGMY